MTIHRYQVTWQGFSGAPGYTSFHFRYPTEPGTTPTIGSALDAWCNSVRTVLPSVVNLTPSLTYQVLDEATGVLINELTDGGSVTAHSGTDTATFASSAGACISLKTTTVAGGRKVRGRIFMVPLGGGHFGTDGTLDPSVATILTGACSTLQGAVSAAPWVVWKRPKAGAGGVGAPITGFAVRDKAAVLRSRRD